MSGVTNNLKRGWTEWPSITAAYLQFILRQARSYDGLDVLTEALDPGAREDIKFMAQVADALSLSKQEMLDISPPTKKAKVQAVKCPAVSPTAKIVRTPKARMDGSSPSTPGSRANAIVIDDDDFNDDNMTAAAGTLLNSPAQTADIVEHTTTEVDSNDDNHGGILLTEEDGHVGRDAEGDAE